MFNIIQQQAKKDKANTLKRLQAQYENEYRAYLMNCYKEDKPTLSLIGWLKETKHYEL